MQNKMNSQKEIHPQCYAFSRTILLTFIIILRVLECDTHLLPQLGIQALQ